jgi:hypothetical protein
MSDDTQLLRRYVTEKSDDAFRELVERYLDLVYSAALRQLGGDVHRAQDIAQDIMASRRQGGSLWMVAKKRQQARRPSLHGGGAARMRPNYGQDNEQGVD